MRAVAARRRVAVLSVVDDGVAIQTVREVCEDLRTFSVAKVVVLFSDRRSLLEIGPALSQDRGHDLGQ